MIEICENWFMDWRSSDLMQIIADNGIFGALVVGRRTENWRMADLGSNDVVMRLDGAIRAKDVVKRFWVIPSMVLSGSRMSVPSSRFD